MVEILTVLTLLGILVALAAPKVSGMLAVGKMEQAMNGLAADIASARMQAVRKGSGSWVRTTSNKRYVVMVGADTVKRVNLATDYPGVTLSTFAIQFNSRGVVATGSGTETHITATQSGVSGTRKLQVSAVGRIYRVY